METQKIARLMNCLETILEMESQLRSIREAGELVMEINALRTLIHDLKQVHIPVDDAEVLRIELATTTFLQELEVQFQYLDAPPSPDRLLQ